jgi:outer membrane protein assembly factor BamA
MRQGGLVAGRTWASAWALAATIVSAPCAQADESETLPLIREIAFEGNEHTRDETMQREIKIAIGDPADPQQIEASRQAIQDLGLFKKVEAREEPLEGGGTRVVFDVSERYYLLPLPRFDAKSDGRYNYGAQLRWDNAWGLNHTLKLLWLEEDAKQQGIGRQTEYSGSYSIPFVDGSQYGLTMYGGYRTRPVDNDDGSAYNESFRDAGFAVSRHLGGPPASQGWRVSAGLDYDDESTSGPDAQPAYGTAISPTFGVRYNDWHYRIFSDVGTRFALNYSFASRTLGSDYHYQRITANYTHAMQIGETDHQTLGFSASTGLYYDGPEQLHPFGLGGSDALRGYDVNFHEGDAFWLVQLEFARPLYEPWPWLRGVVILETGNVVDKAEDFEFGSPRSSLGVGLRVRFKNFVNFEFEAGYAIPLTGGGGRIFASKV